MKTLFVSDIHFSSAPQDEFMWDIFSKLANIISSEDIKHLFVLGDLTKHKTGHSAALVNRVVDGFKDLSKKVSITIMYGNHDGISGDDPFFKFLRHVPNIEFITESVETNISGKYKTVYLPHTRDPLTEWANIDFTGKYVFGHLTVNNALAENMQKLESSVDADYFAKSKLMISGDVHVPQVIGPVIYIGAPFQTNFSGSFDGGVIVLDLDTSDWKRVSLGFLKRHTIDIASKDDLIKQINQAKPGDQVKVRLHIDQSNMGEWRELQSAVKAIADDKQIQLCGLQTIKEYQTVLPTQEKKDRNFGDFDLFCKRQNVSDELIAVGKALIKEACV